MSFVNYEDTFSPVISASATRLIFSIGANQDKHIVKFDVKTAFLNGELNHEIYMNIPESYNIKDKVCSNLGNYSKCKRERRNRADVRP